MRKTQYKKFIKQLEAANSLEDLNALNIGGLTWEVGGRGGYVGFYHRDIVKLLNLDKNAQVLPYTFGAYCNYLGGGIRGSITASGYRDVVRPDQAEVLDAIAQACIRAYKSAEDDMFMNEVEEDGEPNWEAIGTDAARKAGIVSAY